MESQQSTTPKIGRIRRGWRLTKSSWQVFKLDKELASFPLISFAVSVIAFVPFIGVLIATGSLDHLGDSNSSLTAGMPLWGQAIFLLSLWFVVTFIANFFSGALIYGAVERFKGGDPTVRSSLSGAKRKFMPLLLFSLLMSTVGLVFRTLEERLPFAGKIAAYFFDAAWSVANVFAVPVIVLSEENVQPLDATKRSVGVIKKVWGESIVADIGISVIAFASYIFYFAVFGGIIAGLAAATNPTTALTAFIIVPIVIGVIGFIALVAVFSALASIAKAALYYYATTGEAPATFNSELLRTAMTRKKARKIFG